MLEFVELVAKGVALLFESLELSTQRFALLFEFVELAAEGFALLFERAELGAQRLALLFERIELGAQRFALLLERIELGAQRFALLLEIVELVAKGVALLFERIELGTQQFALLFERAELGAQRFALVFGVFQGIAQLVVFPGQRLMRFKRCVGSLLRTGKLILNSLLVLFQALDQFAAFLLEFFLQCTDALFRPFHLLLEGDEAFVLHLSRALHGEQGFQLFNLTALLLLGLTKTELVAFDLRDEAFGPFDEHIRLMAGLGGVASRRFQFLGQGGYLFLESLAFGLLFGSRFGQGARLLGLDGRQGRAELFDFLFRIPPPCQFPAQRFQFTVRFLERGTARSGVV